MYTHLDGRPARFWSSILIAMAFLVSACHSGDAAQNPAYPIAGTITGLTADGLTLQNNGGDNLSPAANTASFQFPTRIAAGGRYEVSIITQPAGMTCIVTHGSGTNLNSAVTGVTVTCARITFPVAGTITGLSASGLILQDNGGADLAVSANAASFQFAAQIPSGGDYDVTVSAQPSGLTCSVTRGAGVDLGGAVTDISVACSEVTHTIGGIVGLTASGLILQNNGGCSLLSAVGTATAPVNNVSVACANIVTYTLTPSAGANGVISPSVAVVINSGGSEGFVATPSAGDVL